jgi:hypothetical protein
VVSGVLAEDEQKWAGGMNIGVVSQSSQFREKSLPMIELGELDGPDRVDGPFI